MSFVKINFLAFFVVGIFNSLVGQTIPSERVVVSLSKGAVLRGDLIAIYPGESYELVSKYGDTISIPEKYLRRIQYLDEADENVVKIERANQFDAQGLYHTASISLNVNTVSADHGGLTGFALSSAFGHQINRWIGYGLGIGADFYHPHQNEMVFPVFVEARGYFLDQPVTPYYTMRFGHGFVFKNEELGLVGGRGGLMLNPSIGWRLSGRSGMNVTLDLGIKIQKATFDRFWNSERSLTELTYKRLNIRLGFLF